MHLHANEIIKMLHNHTRKSVVRVSIHLLDCGESAQIHLVVLQGLYQILICFEQRDSCTGMCLIRQ